MRVGRGQRQAPSSRKPLRSAPPRSWYHSHLWSIRYVPSPVGISVHTGGVVSNQRSNPVTLSVAALPSGQSHQVPAPGRAARHQSCSGAA